MIDSIYDSFHSLMQSGGWVMWPLLVLSITAATCVLERTGFSSGPTIRADLPGWRAWLQLLRHGERRQALDLVDGDRTVYGDLVRGLLSEPPSEAAVTDAIESQRRRLERFMPTVSTIITAAPMLGILGTVLGLIASLGVLSDHSGMTDPANVGAGIAEALITTATGLVIAVIALFPYNALRAQVDRTLSRLEALAAATLPASGTQSTVQAANAEAEVGAAPQHQHDVNAGVEERTHT